MSGRGKTFVGVDVAQPGGEYTVVRIQCSDRELAEIERLERIISDAAEVLGG